MKKFKKFTKSVQNVHNTEFRKIWERKYKNIFENIFEREIIENFQKFRIILQGENFPKTRKI